MKSMTWVTGKRQGLLAARCIDGQWSPLARGGGGPPPPNPQNFWTREGRRPLSPQKAKKTAGCARPRGARGRNPPKGFARTRKGETPPGPPLFRGRKGG